MHNQLLPLLVLLIVACGTKTQKDSPTAEIESPELNQDAGSGGRVGNGGGGVLCRTDDGKINSIELFDFYEARAKLLANASFSYEIDFEPKTASKIDQALELARYVVESRVKSFDPALAKYLMRRLDYFKQETTLSESQLPMTNDIEPLRALHKNCRAIQLAFTAKPDALNPEKFHIYRSAFEHPKFSLTNGAALILHELIYELTALRGETTSVGTRGLIALIFTDKYKEAFATRADYFRIANDAGMPWAGFGNLPVKLEEGYDFHADQKTLSHGFILPGSLAQTKIGDLTIMCKTVFSPQGVATTFTFSDENYAVRNFNFLDSEGQLRTFTIPPRSGIHYTSPSSWNLAYQNRNLCGQNSNPQVVFNETIPYYFFENLNPAYNTSSKNAFFEYSVDLTDEVEILDGIPRGRPARFAGNRSLTFLAKEPNPPCKISKLTHTSIFLENCEANPFIVLMQFARLPIESVERLAEPFLKVKLRDTSSKGEHSIYLRGPADTQNSLLIKLGSKMHFDKNRQIRRAKVMWSRGPICIKGSPKEIRINSAEGLDLEFDENGCIENTPEPVE